MSKIQNKKYRSSFLDLKFDISNLFRASNLEFRAYKSGFTLVEMIVAFGIFAVIMVMSVGSLFSIMQANYKAQTLKTVVNNLHFAFENMSRNLRMGRAYYCDATRERQEDCTNESASSIAFLARDDSRIVYRHNAVRQSIERATKSRLADGSYETILDRDFVPITAPEVKVERLQFFVDGSSPSDNRQPRVLILGSGTMQGRGKVISRFDIETMVSQRLLDVKK